MDEGAIWRAICRYPDLTRTLPELLPLLQAALPVHGVVVSRLATEPAQIQTIAWIGLGAAPGGAPRPCSAAELGLVLARHRAGVPHRGRAEQEPALGVLVPLAGPSDALLVPLGSEAQDPGFLVLLGGAGAFTAAHEHLAAALAEPFGLALTTDRRFHELARLSDIVGADSGLGEVIARVEKVATTDAPVLILGETGSGKEVVARLIHARSRRADGPMVRVNCGAISPGLVDSELFGHERGSFTGALTERAGWFERADHGTLFLDEVGELSLDAQVRLLRVLQEGVLQRVGGNRVIRVDVRIIAATHRDLAHLARAGGFREDLWYRINVFPIELPALRERKQDIPALAAHFARRAGSRLSGQPLALAPGDEHLLRAYDWPGNVRELATVIERAAILGSGKYLDIAAALGIRLRPDRAVSPAPAPGARFPTLDEAVRAHIEAALEATGGRIEGDGGAARLLAVNPHTLRARMRKLGIDWTRFRGITLPRLP